MNTPANDSLHLWLMIGVAALMLLGTSGVAAVMAWMPTPTDLPGAVLMPGTSRPPPATLGGAEAQISPAPREGDAPASVRCPVCGVVESRREIEQTGDGTEPGTAGTVTRGNRNEITGHSTKTYEVTVRMKDGSRHVFVDAKRANWRPGARVMIIGSASRSHQ